MSNNLDPFHPHSLFAQSCDAFDEIRNLIKGLDYEASAALKEAVERAEDARDEYVSAIQADCVEDIRRASSPALKPASLAPLSFSGVLLGRFARAEAASLLRSDHSSASSPLRHSCLLLSPLVLVGVALLGARTAIRRRRHFSQKAQADG